MLSSLLCNHNYEKKTQIKKYNKEKIKQIKTVFNMDETDNDKV